MVGKFLISWSSSYYLPIPLIVEIRIKAGAINIHWTVFWAWSLDSQTDPSVMLQMLLIVLSNAMAISYMWALNTWSVAIGNKESF